MRPGRACPKGGAHAQGLGRSLGGLSTKIHAACDAPGDPVRLLLGPGQQNDMAQAHALVDGLTPEAVIADKGYDADPLHDAILDAGAEPVIPPRRHRRRPHAYDRHLYTERNRIARFFAKLKQFRRVAPRYDKLLANFRGFVPSRRHRHQPRLNRHYALIIGKNASLAARMGLLLGLLRCWFVLNQRSCMGPHRG